MIYLAVPNATTTVERVAVRVRQGGHDIAVDVINRRFHRSLKKLFGLYVPFVNRWKVFNNYYRRRYPNLKIDSPEAEMENAQRTRTKDVAQPNAEDARILDALKRASAEGRRTATADGVPFSTKRAVPEAADQPRFIAANKIGIFAKMPIC